MAAITTIQNAKRQAKPFFSERQFAPIEGQIQRALQDYATAIRLKPEEPANYVNRAGTYVYQMKDYDRALADLNIALKLDPKDAYSYSLRADVWYQKRDYQRAIAAAIKLDPKEPANYKRRANAEGQLRWAWLP